jgi:hypothetical protein
VSCLIWRRDYWKPSVSASTILHLKLHATSSGTSKTSRNAITGQQQRITEQQEQLDSNETIDQLQELVCRDHPDAAVCTVSLSF